MIPFVIRRHCGNIWNRGMDRYFRIWWNWIYPGQSLNRCWNRKDSRKNSRVLSASGRDRHLAEDYQGSQGKSSALKKHSFDLWRLHYPPVSSKRWASGFYVFQRDIHGKDGKDMAGMDEQFPEGMFRFEKVIKQDDWICSICFIVCRRWQQVVNGKKW